MTVSAATSRVGVLNAAGVTQLAGVPLNQGMVATILNVVVGLWGLVAGFTAKK